MNTTLTTGIPSYLLRHEAVVKCLFIALAYYALGRLGLMVLGADQHISLIWLPAGIAVAALLRWGYISWFGIFLGTLSVNYSIDGLLFLDICIALGNSAATMLVAWLLKRMRFSGAFDRSSEAPVFVMVSAMGTLVSASVGVGSLMAFNILPAAEVGAAWLSWWAGDFTGILLVGPLLLNISRYELGRLWKHRTEFAVWCMSAAVVSWAVFIFNHDAYSYSHPIVFIVLPFVVWSAISFGVMGSSLGMLIPIFVAAWATGQSIGPFDPESTKNGIFIMWLFFATLVSVELTVAALQAGRKRAENAIRADRDFNKGMIQSLPGVFYMIDERGKFLMWNSQFETVLQRGGDEVARSHPLDFVLKEEASRIQGEIRKGFESGELAVEAELVIKDGTRIPYYFTGRRIMRDGMPVLVGMGIDIAERKASDEKIRHMMNLYATLSQCNQAIVRCINEEELFQQVCRDVVEFGGMGLAWIGMVDEASQMIKSVAVYGTGVEYVEGIQISIDPNQPSGCGPAAIAVRENKPEWIQDFQNDVRLAPWRERAAKSGWASGAALPLYRNGKTIGALLLYSRVVNAFDEASRHLLESMTTDISYALTRFALIEERRLTEEAMKIAAVTFETQEAIVITDAEARILRVNKAFQNITGYSAQEAVGHNPRMLKSGQHDAHFYQAMWTQLLSTGKWSGEICDRRKNGETYQKFMTITAVHNDQQQVIHYVGVFRDISDQMNAEQEIHRLAFYDPLTKLPNRRLLMDTLQHAMAASLRHDRHGALLFIDLDHFKYINDTQGHAKGDQLLIEVAQRLQGCVRDSDSVGRLGGDEFVVLLEDLSCQAEEAARQVELVVEKIRSKLNMPYLLQGTEYLSTASIGITLFYGHTESVENLLKYADVAMYQAKTAGRNVIRFFDPKMQADLNLRAVMENELRQALEKQQFRLFYQVQVDSVRRPIGAEVLLRWVHPERGLVSPMQFIPIAEEAGLISSIGLWVLVNACVQLQLWQDNDQMRDLTLSVNVSAKQFRQPDFVAQVRRALWESNANPSHLKLELTESAVLESIEDTISKMSELKQLGISFSMDDFGTGYSSLQYLKRLPLDEIKIDQTFVRDITSDQNDAAIVQTIIAMSETLGLTVIAEGVETQEQLDFLELRGCHAYQGYLFSRPVNLTEFEALLQGESVQVAQAVCH